MREAWALRRLSERFGSRGTAGSFEAELMAQMAKDHLRALQSGAREMKAALQPVWAHNAKPVGGTVDLVLDGLSWDEGVLKVFRLSEELDAAIYAFFATDNAMANGPALDAEAGVSRILRPVMRLASNFGWSKEQIAVQFLANTGNPGNPRR